MIAATITMHFDRCIVYHFSCAVGHRLSGRIVFGHCIVVVVFNIRKPLIRYCCDVWVFYGFFVVVGGEDNMKMIKLVRVSVI